MIYKRKGIDFCAHPGCLYQDYGGEISGLRYCLEHIEVKTIGDFQADLDYCVQIAAEQGVEFGKFASSQFSSAVIADERERT